MSFNIRDIKAGLIHDGARASHFSIEINFPANLRRVFSNIPSIGVSGDNSVNGTLTVEQKIEYTAQAASFPASNISPIIVNYFGREIKLAGNRTFEDWTVTFYNDEDFSVRNVFENWLAAINGHENNVRQPQYGIGRPQNDYKASGIIKQYDKTGLSVVKKYEMVGMFPINVGAINAEWSSNEVQTFEVTFAYDYWQSAELQDNISGR